MEPFLAQVPLFQLLDSEEARILSAAFETVRHRQGEAIFHFGDPGDSLYIVQSGRVELSVTDHSGQKIVLKTAGPGELFGELSLLDQGPRTASAAALEDCEFLRLTREDLFDFLRRKPEAALDLLSALGRQIRRTNDLLRGRVARNPNLEMEAEFKWGQKIANAIADFSGSMTFLWANAFLFASWIVINVGLIPGIQAFDPYPFGFLTMAVSLEAIFLSIFVLLSQNLQAAKDRIRGDIEYEVNLKAELEVAHLHEKLDQMNAEVLKRLSEIEKAGRK